MNEANFVVVDEITEARDDARRAAILLRLSDAVLIEKAGVIFDACREAGFADGANYVAVRLAVQSAGRSPTGEVPAPLIDQAEYWRRGLLAVVGTRS